MKDTTIENSTQEVSYSFNEEEGHTDDIAIIGMGGRFPGADNLSVFWNNLREGRNFVGDLSDNRLALITEYLHLQGHDISNLEVRRMGYLKHVETFDYEFFKISSMEAVMMNPNHRMFLETAWHALENAGYSKNKIKGTRTGIYFGYNNTTDHYYKLLEDYLADYKGLALTGNLPSMATSRLSHMLDLRGPNLLIDTSCSSSLVAVYLACAGLINDDCDYALAGGIKIVLNPLKGKGDDVGINSTGGNVRAFDDHADGTVGGEGCGMVLLKKLEKAQKDGDIIHAIIKGGAYNHDGNSIGIAAPNAAAQAEVLKKAWLNSGIEPEEIDYIESHGTGTRLGDPIEINGIRNAFNHFTTKRQFCGIGSLKTNIGHLDSAAGIASLLKTVLAIKHASIPPSLGFEKPNREIDFINSPVYVNDRLSDWHTKDKPRIAGINSFGISGTNCHLVVQEAPTNTRKNIAYSLYLLPISAKNVSSLQKLISAYLECCTIFTNDKLASLCYTASIGRDHHKYRIAVIFKDKEELSQKLIRALDSFSEPTIKDLHFFRGDSSSKDSDKAHTITYEVVNKLIKKYDSNELQSHLTLIASHYVGGEEVAWNKIYKGQKIAKVELPLYPFQGLVCWPTPKEQKIESNYQPEIKMNPATSPNVSSLVLNYEEIVIKKLVSAWSTLFGIEEEAVEVDKDFFEMGLDSISIIQVKQLVKKEFQVEVEVNSLFGELSTFKSLANHIDNQMSKKIENEAFVTESLNQGMLNLQMRQIEEQLKAIRQMLEDKNLNAELPIRQTLIRKKETKTVEPKDSFLPLNPLTPIGQEQHSFKNEELEKFIHSYCKKTASSKKITQRYRHCFANNRNVSAYKREFKELTYPIFATSANGARFTDVDNNVFLDFASGFGVSLLGHNHPAVVDEVQKQLKEGVFLGPMSPKVGEVAELITELTGMDRVAFYNSGTEAVMVAMRLARAYTGKTKIVLFDGAYHGTYDGVLVQKDLSGNNGKGLPKSNGIPDSVVDDVLILDYGTAESLNLIQKNIHDLAGVLVEPIQSRRPNFQPVEFLRQLRSITYEGGIPLIFDEIVTGFRVHPGGVQGLFDIKADLVTYGKVIGGGYPIGLVAGKEEYMVGVDGGGNWNYSDSSEPRFDHRKTFVTGTFCHHPVSIAAAKGILSFLKAEGAAFQERLNNLTSDFADEVNHYFEENDIPISIAYFGSQFIIKTGFDPRYLLYLLINQGIYCWEGMTFYFGNAHTKEDTHELKQALYHAADVLKDYKIISINSNKENDNADLKTGPVFSYYPASQAQLRLWLTDKTLTNKSVFNMTNGFLIQTQIDVSALKRSLQYLINRHEILRTSFVLQDEKLMQRISSSLLIDTILEEGDIQFDEIELSPFVHEFGNRSFDFDNNLFRVGLFHLSDGNFIFIWNVHHIIFDGWSMEIMMNELLIAYTSYSIGEEPSLDSLKAQYRDFTEWENTELESIITGDHKDFWSSKLSNLPVLDLALDFPRPKLKTFNGEGLKYYFEGTLKEQIEKYSHESKVSTFMTLLSTVFITLHKYTDQDDIILGTTTAGRNIPNTENQLGFFVNLLPLRLSVLKSRTFSELTGSVKKELLDCIFHQQYPYNILVQDFASEQDPSRSPLFDVLVEMTTVDNHYSMVHTNADNMMIKGIEVQSNFTQYDLSFRFSKLDYITLEYNKDLFTRSKAENILQGFITILKECLQYPQNKISSLHLLDEKHYLKITKEFNQQIINSDSCDLLTELNRLFGQFANDLCLIEANKSLTFAELDCESSRVAGYLQNEINLIPGDIVAVFIDRSIEFVCSVIGIMRAGGVFVPIDTNLPIERLKLILEDCTPKSILMQSDHFLELSDANISDLVIYDISIAEYDANRFHANQVDKDQAAYIIYTSGTTGRPKGVSLTSANLSNYISWANDYYFNGEHSYNMPFFTSVAFDLTLTSIFSTLMRGDVLTIIRSDDVRESLKYIFDSSNGLKAVKLTPSHLIIAKYLSLKEISISKVICGGESLGDHHISFLRDLAPEIEVYNEYGPTETSIGSTVQKIEKNVDRNIIGKPVKNTSVFILGKDHQMRPIGTYGEVFIGGRGVANGYINNQELTDQKFINLPELSSSKIYATGDYGRWLTNGCIELLGRKDNQVKINGNRIELDEIKNTLLFFDSIRHAEVIAEIDDDMAINAYIIKESDEALSIIDQYLSSHLPHYMIPTNIFEVKEFPLTINGKLDVRQLKQNVLKSKNDNNTNKTLPNDPLEYEIASAWKSVLKVQLIYREDRFFELGGNSLSATIISGILSDKFNVSVAVQHLLTNPSVTKLAALVEELCKSKELEAANVIVYENEFPLEPKRRVDCLYRAGYSQKKEYLRCTLTGTNSFNTSLFIPFPKKFKDNIESIIRKLVLRHEALRTTFIEQNGEVYQVIHDIDQWELPLEYIETSHLDKKELDDRAVDLTTNTSFDLSQGPLSRFVITKIDAKTCCLLVIISHSVSDAQSLNIIREDFDQLMSGVLNEETKDLFQLKDYTEWSTKLVDSASYRKKIDEYVKRLKSSILKEHGERIDFSYKKTLQEELNKMSPGISPAKSVHFFGSVVNLYPDKGNTYKICIGNDLLIDLKKMSFENGNTLFISVLSAWVLNDYQINGHRHQRIMIPATTRIHNAFTRICGWLTSEIVFAVEINNDLAFLALSQMIKANLETFKEYKFYPHERLLNDLDVSLEILIPVFINYVRRPNIEMTDFETQTGVNGTGHFPLKVDLIEYDNGIVIDTHYNTKFHSEKSIQYLYERLIRVLRNVAKDPKYVNSAVID